MYCAIPPPFRKSVTWLGRQPRYSILCVHTSSTLRFRLTPGCGRDFYSDPSRPCSDQTNKQSRWGIFLRGSAVCADVLSKFPNQRHMGHNQHVKTADRTGEKRSFLVLRPAQVQSSPDRRKSYHEGNRTRLIPEINSPLPHLVAARNM